MDNFYYLLGLYLGDGSITKKHVRSDGSIYYKFNIVCLNKEMEELIVTELRNIDEPFNIGEEIYESERIGKYKVLSSNSQKICNYLISYVGDSYNKHIPIFMNEEQKWSVLSGLIDSDGSVSGSRVKYQTTDENLQIGFVRLLEELNIRYRIRKDQPKWVGSKEVWTIFIQTQDVNKLKLNLLIDYKRDNLKSYQENPRHGGYVEIDKGFYLEHFDELKELLPARTFCRLKAHYRDNEKLQIRSKVYDTINAN